MRLTRLELSNFLSIQKLSLDLEDRGLVLIKGNNLDNSDYDSNGSGKSSIIEGIDWTLYGKTVRGIKGDEVVHDKVGKNCMGKISLEDDDGSRYEFVRYRKHKTHKNAFLIYKDGQDITPRSEEQATKLVEKILQMDNKTFVNTILYSSQAFKFTSMTDRELKEAFDVILDLEVFNGCQEIAKERMSSMDKKFSTIQNQIESAKQSINQRRQDIKNAEEAEKDWEEEWKQKVKKIKSDIKEAKAELELEVKKSVNIKEIPKIKKELIKLKESLKDLEKMGDAMDKLRSKQAESKGQIQAFIKQRRVIESSIEDLEDQYKNANDLIGTDCPVCGTFITEDNLGHVMEDLKNKIAEQQKLISDIDKAQDELQKLIDEAAKELEEYGDYKVQYSELVSEIKSKEAKIRLIQQEVDNQQLLVNRLEKGVAEKEARLEKYREELSPYDSIIEGHQEKIDEAEGLIEELSVSGTQLKADILELEFWVKAFGNSGIKSLLLDEVTPYLNQRANHYLQQLSSDSIEVIFTTQTKLKDGQIRDKFAIDVVNYEGGKKYIANSGGEKRRVDIAVNLALQDLIAHRSAKRLNIAIYDEVFDAMDEVGTERIVDLLKDMTKEKSSIFVTSHSESLKALFDKSVTMEKSEGFSRLIQ